MSETAIAVALLLCLVGGALGAWFTREPLWKGAVVVAAGLALNLLSLLIAPSSAMWLSAAAFLVGALFASSMLKLRASSAAAIVALAFISPIAALAI